MARAAPPTWFPRRGEVYRVALLGGKTRPAVIFSTDALNRFALDVCVIPLTTVRRAEFSLRVLIRARDGGLNRDSWATCDQVQTLEKTALLHPPLGRLSLATMARLGEAVRVALEF